jgi:hypothetical protein
VLGVHEVSSSQFTEPEHAEECLRDGNDVCRHTRDAEVCDCLQRPARIVVCVSVGSPGDAVVRRGGIMHGIDQARTQRIELWELDPEYLDIPRHLRGREVGERAEVAWMHVEQEMTGVSRTEGVFRLPTQSAGGSVETSSTISIGRVSSVLGAVLVVVATKAVVWMIMVGLVPS